MSSESIDKSSAVVVAPTSKGAIERPKSERDARLMRMREMEDDLLETSLETLTDALAWNEFSPEDLKQEVIETLPEDEARRRRTALAANLPAGSAPVGLKIASNFVAGVMKARAATAPVPGSGGPLVVIQLPAPVSKDIAEGRKEYEVIDVE